MNFWRIFCLLCAGAFLESAYIIRFDPTTLLTLTLVGAIGWKWEALRRMSLSLRDRIAAALTGHARAAQTTGPQNLAAELASLDERLRRVEQQTPYVQAGRTP